MIKYKTELFNKISANRELVLYLFIDTTLFVVGMVNFPIKPDRSCFFMKKLAEKAYGILDIVYFKKIGNNPRKQIITYFADKPLRILDMCCGTGKNAMEIASANTSGSIVGIDISTEALKKADSKIHKRNLRNVTLLRMDAAHTTFQDKSFDGIIISLVLHELKEKYNEKIIQEAKRLLKDNGTIIVLEWELPTSLFRKILFVPVAKSEPRGFEAFVTQNMKQYFLKHGLKTINLVHCDYSQVIFLKKNCVKTEDGYEQSK